MATNVERSLELSIESELENHPEALLLVIRSLVFATLAVVERLDSIAYLMEEKGVRVIHGQS